MKSALSLALLAAVGGTAAAQDLLPDIVTRQSDLYDHVIQIENGRRVLRLSNGTPNIGDGKLYLFGVLPANPDGSQDVRQRVYNASGGFTDRLAGKFTYHPGHSHIHFDGWAEYTIREVLPGDGVGPVLATGGKTSFCILDLGVYDTSLPNYNPSGQFFSCTSTTQGLSVGWLDVYDRNLPGQFIDVHDLPDGEYWLESTVDPDNLVLEKNETNNASRIKVTIGQGTTLTPDAFEPNQTRAEVDPRPVGQNNSPNLGPCAPSRTITDLTIDSSTDIDYYKFYMPASGTNNDFVRIDFQHGQGDLDMYLVSTTGSLLASSESTQNFEQISMNGRARGWYFVRVFGWSGDTSPDYTLTINPSANNAPTITTLTPPAGNIDLNHGSDTYQVNWTAADPDADPTWVTLYLNDAPVLDGTELIIPPTLHTPGSTGFAIVNSAEVPPGTYYAYLSITDGGVVGGDWSAGTVSFNAPECPADANEDTTLDAFDFNTFVDAFNAGNLATADQNGDTTLDAFDFNAFVDNFNAGCP